MKNIAVVIRTYSRILDTLALIKIIKEKWKAHRYSLFVVHNGAADGHVFPENTLPEDVCYIQVSENSGHQAGASDLLVASFDYLSDSFDYTLFIESDVWPLHDDLLCEALEHDFDVATTIWVESKQSLAVDYFIVSQKFLLQNKAMLAWKTKNPEVEFKNYLLTTKAKIYIFSSLRPIHMPSFLNKMCKYIPVNVFPVWGRFNFFPKLQYLTFHIEMLPNGIFTKKQMANLLLGYEFFDIPIEIPSLRLTKWEFSGQQIARFFPQSSWLKKKYWKSFRERFFLPY